MSCSEPTNIQQLELRLCEEGCNPDRYAIATRGDASDAFCLIHNGEKWRIYYTERGRDSAPIFESAVEEAACRFFFDHIMTMRHQHCVGIFQAESRAQNLGAWLSQHGLLPRHDKIRYGGPHDPRYRVFVGGKAIFKTRELLGDVPLRD